MRFPAVPYAFIGTTLTISLIITAPYSVMNLGALPRHYEKWRVNAAKRSYIVALNTKIGSEGVAASDRLLPHLSHRERIYLFPNPWKVHYWGVNGENPHHPNVISYIILDSEAIRLNQALYDYLIDSGIFTLMSNEYGIVTLKRVRSEAANRMQSVADFSNYAPIPAPAFTHLRLSRFYPTVESEFRRLHLDPADTQSPDDYTLLPDQPAGSILDLALGEAGKSDFTTRYLFTELNSLNICTVQLSLGSDDGVTVWHNEKKVLEDIVLRPTNLGDDVVNLKLKRGKNSVVFRVNNATGAFRLQARLKMIRCACNDGSYVNK